MSQSFGKKFKVTYAGESHGPGYTVIIEGHPSNKSLDLELIKRELASRKPGQSSFSTPRSENEEFQVLSGVFEGKTTGAPITLFIPNEGQNSKDYSHLKDLARPGHADLVLNNRFSHRDYRGGGWSSARMTVTWVAAGAMAQVLLLEKGVKLYAYTQAVGEISQTPISYEELPNVKWDNELYSPLGEQTEKMKQAINFSKNDKDSIGGQCRVIATGVPKNLGAPFGESLKSKIAQYFFTGPAITALEFGSGTRAAHMKGSEHNDLLNEESTYLSNNHGGIQAGISTGEPIDLLVTLKAPSSISKIQNLYNMNEDRIENTAIEGRHDPCVVPRYCAVARALLSLALVDCLSEQ